MNGMFRKLSSCRPSIPMRHCLKHPKTGINDRKSTQSRYTVSKRKENPEKADEQCSAKERFCAGLTRWEYLGGPKSEQVHERDAMRSRPRIDSTHETTGNSPERISEAQKLSKMPQTPEGRIFGRLPASLQNRR